VYVLPFSSQENEVRYSGSTDFGVLLSEYLAGALQENGIAAVAVPPGAAVPSHARAIVRGTLTTLDPGSWNLRFWVGFNAGRALIAARVELQQPPGTEVFAQSYTARSQTLQFSESILRRVASKLARSAAKDIGLYLQARRAG